MLHNYSYWEKSVYFKYDIVLIGSGIVGLNAAISLKTQSPCLKIAILESGFLPSGASTKNAGFACFGSISELIEQEKKIGEVALHSLIKRRWDGLKKLRALLGDQQIEFRKQGGYELFTSKDNLLANACDAKLEHFNALTADITGTSSTFVKANEKIAQFGFNGVKSLLENREEASIHTGKMMYLLTELAQQLGVKIYNSCQVKSIDDNQFSKHLETNHGIFEAKAVLVCTNAFAKTFFKNIDLYPGRGQVIVTNSIPNLKLEGTFHYDQGYYYFRNIDNRILIGGGRNLDFEAETTTEFGTTELVQKSLVSLLREVIIPEQEFRIEHSWSGIMAFGTTLEPIIEEVSPGIFCGLRCNGMGIAIGSQVGEDLANLAIKHV